MESNEEKEFNFLDEARELYFQAERELDNVPFDINLKPYYNYVTVTRVLINEYQKELEKLRKESK